MQPAVFADCVLNQGLKDCLNREVLFSIDLNGRRPSRIICLDWVFTFCEQACRIGRYARGTMFLQRIRLTGNPSDVEQLWVSAVLSGLAESGSVSIAGDAGTGLARRLLEEPVYLDRFELRSELGVGSFGYVFQALDPRLERVVALKVQRAGNFASAEDVERFLREARSAAQLKHPSIVSLFETGQTEDDV